MKRPATVVYRIPLDALGGVAELALPLPLEARHIRLVRKWLTETVDPLFDATDAPQRPQE